MVMYICKICEILFSEDNIYWDWIENEPLCPKCSGYLFELI